MATISSIEIENKEPTVLYNGHNGQIQNISPAETDCQANGQFKVQGSNDISCEMIINLNNENNMKQSNDVVRYVDDEHDSHNECMSAVKIDSNIGVDINNKKDSISTCSNSNNKCDSRTLANSKTTTEKQLPAKHTRNRRGSIVLELDCSTQSFGEKGTCIENYKSKLTSEDCNDSDCSSLGEGELVTNRQFEECATKSHRGWQEGDEVLTESEIKFRENETVTQTKEGKKISEYSFRSDENHVSTTFSFEVLGDKVLRTARTNRRSSTSSSMKMENDSTEGSIKSGSDTDMLSLPSASDIKENQQKEKADKYAVSFNSDTESSEDESDSEVSSVSDKKETKTINGHIGDTSVSNDVTSSEAKLSIDQARIICNGYKKEIKSSEKRQQKSSSSFEEISGKSKTEKVSEELSSKVIIKESKIEDGHSKLDNAMDNIGSELKSKLQDSFSKENNSAITTQEKSEAYDATIVKCEKSNEDCATGKDKEFDLPTDSNVNKNTELSPGPSFSFTVDCSESSTAASTSTKKKFTVCDVETNEISREEKAIDRQECNTFKDDKKQAASSESETMLIDTSSSSKAGLAANETSLRNQESILSSTKPSTTLNEDKIQSKFSLTNATAVKSEQNRNADFLITEQKDQNKSSSTFSSQQRGEENKASTTSKASNLDIDAATESKLPTALLDLFKVDGGIKLSSMESEEGTLIDVSSVVETEAKLQGVEQQTKSTVLTSEKMAENSSSLPTSPKMTNGDFKLSDELIHGNLSEQTETSKFVNNKNFDNEINDLPKGIDNINKYDLPSNLDNFRLDKEFQGEETMEFTRGGKPRKDFKNFEDELDFFGDSQTSNVRVMDEQDGSKAFEKTTTYIAGDRSSTDDLIKRILAEARGEAEPTNKRRTEGYRYSMEDDNVQGGSSYESRSTERSKREVFDDHDEFARYEMDDDHQHYRQMGRGTSSDREKEPSLLERRLASMGLDKKSQGIGNQAGHYGEDFEESQYSSRGRGSDRRLQYSGGHFDDLDSYGDHESQGSDRGSYQRRQQFRSGLMRKQQAVYHDDEWDDDDDDHPFQRRQPVEEYIPDEEFVPKKAEDTDRVVKERTEEIRKVVDNQSNVLERLKSASDSFDEMSSEIKEIKQQFLDSQMRRSMILDEIEHERMFMDQMEYERQKQPQPQPSYAPPGYNSRRGIPRRLEDDDDDFESKYKPPRAPTRHVELDKELEEDRLGRGTLSSLAIGTSGKTSYSSYGGSGKTSSYLDSYKTKYSDDLDMDKTYGGASGLKSRTSYGLSSRGRSGRSQSLYDDIDMDNDTSDYGSASKTRTRLAAKYGLNLGGGGDQNGADEDDNVSESSSYKSPNLPSYRKYDYNDTSDSQKSYDSSYSSPYKSRYGNGNTNSRSASTSRLSNYSRSKTVDYNFDSPSSSYDKPSYGTGASKYSSAATTSNFSSRFLNKVREKKAGGEEIKRDKPFTSRFLGKSVDLTGPPSFARPSFGNSYGSTKDDYSVKSGGSSSGKTPEPPADS